MRTGAKERYVMAAMGSWALVAAVGLALIVGYAFRPSPAAARGDWPEASTLECQSGRPTLVVFLHPKCPCSEATLFELSAALCDFRGNSPAYVLFSVPIHADAAWRDTALIDQARHIPGVTVVFDEGGIESARFGVRTSGQVMLFDAARRCVFGGGITPSRGHEGDTVGRAVIDRVMVRNQTPASPVRSPVFGCALYSSSMSDRSKP